MPDPRVETVLPELTPAQKALLQSIPARFPAERIDRLWIFPPHLGKRRETGLFVLSLFPLTGDTALEPAQRVVVTVSYEAEKGSGAPRYQERVVEEGWAPPERIDRIIAGVQTRSGMDALEPLVESIGGDAERWRGLTDQLLAERPAPA